MKALKLEESGLVRLAGQGDLSMFNNLVLQYQDQVFNHAYRLLEDYDAAEDITQDAFLLSISKIPSVSRRVFTSLAIENCGQPVL